jgi:hypothetical protein
MMNWNLVPGSMEAIGFLMVLKQLGINKIFDTKSIKVYLKYHHHHPDVCKT